MQNIVRRRLFKLAGAGSVVAAGAALPVVGRMASRVLAGHPGAPSEFGGPGLARIIRVASVGADASLLSLRGVVEDRSQLRVGESPQVALSVDRARGVIEAPFVGQPVELTLV